MSFTDPYRVHADRGNGPEPALLLDWAQQVQRVGDVEQRVGKGMCVFGDGSIEELTKEWITVDFRYNPKTDGWVDGSSLPSEDEADDEAPEGG